VRTFSSCQQGHGTQVSPVNCVSSLKKKLDLKMRLEWLKSVAVWIKAQHGGKRVKVVKQGSPSQPVAAE